MFLTSIRLASPAPEKRLFIEHYTKQIYNTHQLKNKILAIRSKNYFKAFQQTIRQYFYWDLKHLKFIKPKQLKEKKPGFSLFCILFFFQHIPFNTTEANRKFSMKPKVRIN